MTAGSKTFDFVGIKNPAVIETGSINIYICYSHFYEDKMNAIALSGWTSPVGMTATMTNYPAISKSFTTIYVAITHPSFIPAGLFVFNISNLFFNLNLLLL
jgi:hypothetical protein